MGFVERLQVTVSRDIGVPEPHDLETLKYTNRYEEPDQMPYLSSDLGNDSPGFLINITGFGTGNSLL